MHDIASGGIAAVSLVSTVSSVPMCFCAAHQLWRPLVRVRVTMLGPSVWGRKGGGGGVVWPTCEVRSLQCPYIHRMRLRLMCGTPRQVCQRQLCMHGRVLRRRQLLHPSGLWQPLLRVSVLIFLLCACLRFLYGLT